MDTTNGNISPQHHAVAHKIGAVRAARRRPVLEGDVAEIRARTCIKSLLATGGNRTNPLNAE